MCVVVHHWIPFAIVLLLNRNRVIAVCTAAMHTPGVGWYLWGSGHTCTAVHALCYPVSVRQCMHTQPRQKHGAVIAYTLMGLVVGSWCAHGQCMLYVWGACTYVQAVHAPLQIIRSIVLPTRIDPIRLEGLQASFHGCRLWLLAHMAD